MGLALALAAFLLLANAGMTFAAEVLRVAQVEKLTGQVTILRAGVHVPIKVGDPLFEKDVVETGRTEGSVLPSSTTRYSRPAQTARLGSTNSDSIRTTFRAQCWRICGWEPLRSSRATLRAAPLER
jgi:hypothetical protein